MTHNAVKKARLLVHIGPHKTGSTYIQTMFVQNRDALRQLGVLYPRIHVRADPGHSLLVEKIAAELSSDLMARVIQRTARTIAAGQNIVWSSENFDRLSAAQLETLKATLPLRPVFYFFLRTSPDLLYSSWQEDVKHGAPTSFARFLYEHLSKPFQSALLNPTLILDRYASVFGVDSIALLDYEALKQEGEDIFLRLLEAMKIPSADLSVSGDSVNRSMRYDMVETIRILNCLGKINGCQSSANPRIWVLQSKDTHVHALVAKVKEAVTEAATDIVVPNSGFILDATRGRLLAKYGNQFVTRSEPERIQHGPPIVSFKYMDDSLLISKGGLDAAQELFALYKADRKAAPLRTLMTTPKQEGAHPKPPFKEGFPPGHFYSVLPDSETIARVAIGPATAVPEALPGIDMRPAEQLRLLEELKPYAGDFPYQTDRSDPQGRMLRYALKNGMFSTGDALVLQCFLRHFRPKRVIEVGSGYSSAVMLDTNEFFLDGRMSLTFVEPYPERLNKLLNETDMQRATIHAARVQSVDLDIFRTLASGDLLFIDSSHVGKAGSDLLHLLFEVLPVLPSGCYVHFHDIFWPFEYPMPWYREGRAWNEAYFVRALLANSSKYQVVLHNHFLAARQPEVLADALPRYFEGSGGSIYLIKT